MEVVSVRNLLLELEFDGEKVQLSPQYYLSHLKCRKRNEIEVRLLVEVLDGNEHELGRCIAEHLHIPTNEVDISSFLMKQESALKYRAVSESDIRIAREALANFSSEEPDQDKPDEDDDWDKEGSEDKTGESLKIGDKTSGKSPDTSADAASGEEDSRPSPEGDPSADTEDGSGESRPEDEDTVDIDIPKLQFGKPRKPGDSESKVRPPTSPPKPSTQKQRGSRKPPSKSIETTAIDIIKRYGEEVLGVAIKDRQSENIGWDLEFHYPDGRRELVEVKGSQHDEGFIVTRNELEAARSEPNHILFFVHNLRGMNGPSIAWFDDFGTDVNEEHLKAISYDVRKWRTLGHKVIDITLADSQE